MMMQPQVMQPMGFDPNAAYWQGGPWVVLMIYRAKGLGFKVLGC